MKKTYLPIVFFTTVLILYLFKVNQDIPSRDRYVPTEYIDKKNKKKEFKENRKEWIENMHRAHPEDDWRLLDKINRGNITILNIVKNIT